MRILVACEFSGTVRDAFKSKGHDAWSCDLLPTDRPGNHIQDNCLKHLDDGWDMLIAFPPCTYLCSSGIGWNSKTPGRETLTNLSVEFVKRLWNCNIPKIAIENPVGVLSSRMCKPTQIIQPYEFGHDASKTTCLWLQNLPKLVGTKYVPPLYIRGKPRWVNQAADSGGSLVPPHELRWKERSLTYSGIAEAMAEQWS